MYLELQKQLAETLRGVLKTKYNVDVENIPLETPPELKFGEVATPIALQLARTLRKAPKIIAQEIVEALGTVEGFAGFEVAGAGYINARIDRGEYVIEATQAATPQIAHTHFRVANPPHSLVEHTSINPNKAAHIGHLRNAILGDTFVRLLRAAGQKVDVPDVRRLVGIDAGVLDQ